MSRPFLTHADEEEASRTGATLPDGGGVVLQPDAGHHHEHQRHRREAEKTSADHEGARRLDVS